MTSVTLVVNTLNEEKNLPRLIGSVKKLISEIVVVDMHSEDKTREIAQRQGACVYLYERKGYVEPARNYAISKAKSEWVLILDADEELSPGLLKKISEILENPEADYYRIPRKNIIFGKWIKHGMWWPDYNIRLFRKGYVSWSEVIHSVPLTKGVGFDIEVREDFSIIHHNYQSVEQYLLRLNRYTSKQAEDLHNRGYRFNWRDLISKPSAEFLNRYFANSGYKDGVHGLALAGLQAFSEFVVYLKAWQMDKFKDYKPDISSVISEVKSSEADFHYWSADSLIREGAGIKERIKRKFKIR